MRKILRLCWTSSSFTLTDRSRSWRICLSVPLLDSTPAQGLGEWAKPVPAATTSDPYPNGKKHHRPASRVAAAPTTSLPLPLVLQSMLTALTLPMQSPLCKAPAGRCPYPTRHRPRDPLPLGPLSPAVAQPLSLRKMLRLPMMISAQEPNLKDLLPRLDPISPPGKNPSQHRRPSNHLPAKGSKSSSGCKNSVCRSKERRSSWRKGGVGKRNGSNANERIDRPLLSRQSKMLPAHHLSLLRNRRLPLRLLLLTLQVEQLVLSKAHRLCCLCNPRRFKSSNRRSPRSQPQVVVLQQPRLHWKSRRRRGLAR